MEMNELGFNYGIGDNHAIHVEIMDIAVEVFISFFFYVIL